MNVHVSALLWGVMVMCAVPVLAKEVAPATKNDTATVSGVVVDGNGEPVAGAAVSLFHDITDPPRHWKPVCEEVTTDEKGRFEFTEVPKSHTWYAVMGRKVGMAPAFGYVPLADGEDVDKKLIMAPAVRGVVVVRDGDGSPLAGATIRALQINSANGTFWVNTPRSWATFDYDVPQSNDDGDLRLPPLPMGASFSAIIQHPGWAAARIEFDATRLGEPIEVALKHGVELVLHLKPAGGASLPEQVTVTLVHDPVEHPSSIIRYPFSVDKKGNIRLIIAPGRYRALRVADGDFVVAPVVYAGTPHKTFLEFPENKPVPPFEFQVLPRRTVRGRAINKVTGKPIVDALVGSATSIQTIRAELPAERQSFVDEWMYSESERTDQNGFYEVESPPGLARLFFSHKGYMSEEAYYNFNVSKTGTTTGPTIHAHPIPTVRGVVKNETGESVAGAVVKMRGDRRGMTPVLTDDQGRFEVSLKWFPVEGETQERAPIQPLVAFHPDQRLMAVANVDLSKPNSLQGITLTLKPEQPGALLDNFHEEMSDWERNDISEEKRAKEAALSLQGQPAPLLDGTWLNVPAGIDGLEDFRGRYVLLDFWFIGCGPCRAEVPALKTLHDVYHDQGVTIIAVHNKSQPANVVKEYIAKENYPFPVLVDDSDGSTLSRYKAHGISGFPSYILIGPDGKVIQADDTEPVPSLRIYKFEILRELLLGDGGAGDGGG